MEMLTNPQCAGVSVARDEEPPDKRSPKAVSDASNKPHWNLSINFAVGNGDKQPWQLLHSVTNAYADGEDTATNLAKKLCSIVTGRGAKMLNWGAWSHPASRRPDLSRKRGARFIIRDKRWERRMSLMRKFLLVGTLTTLAAAPANAGPILTKSLDATVDFTFSLECRQLESIENQTIHLLEYDAVSKFEQDHGVALYASGTADGVEDYYPQGRIAFKHGEPDGTSLPAAGGLHVVEVTPEGITLRGQSCCGSEKGFFDRRTGHGKITSYRSDGKGENDLGGEPGETVWKQYIFECKPSPPAKF
jgi:hypothetical protein